MAATDIPERLLVGAAEILGTLSRSGSTLEAQIVLAMVSHYILSRTDSDFETWMHVFQSNVLQLEQDSMLAQRIAELASNTVAASPELFVPAGSARH